LFDALSSKYRNISKKRSAHRNIYDILPGKYPASKALFFFDKIRSNFFFVLLFEEKQKNEQENREK